LREILRKIKLAIIRFLCLGLLDKPDPTSEALASLDKLKARLEELKMLAAKVTAAEYNIEHDLAVERQWLARLEEKQVSVLEIESARSKVADLSTRLEQAQFVREQAREQVNRFDEEIKTAHARVRDAQLQNRLADLMKQAQNIVFDSALQKDFSAIERIEDSARQSRAQADAAAELNAALGFGEENPPDSPPEGRAGK